MITKSKVNAHNQRLLVTDWWVAKVRMEEALTIEERIAYAKLLGILSSALAEMEA